MRVTANTFPNNLLDELTSLSQRQNKLQTQAASGQLVRLPEDDPEVGQFWSGLERRNGRRSKSSHCGTSRKRCPLAEYVPIVSMLQRRRSEALSDRW